MRRAPACRRLRLRLHAASRRLRAPSRLLTRRCVRCAAQAEEDGPRPLTGFFFGNVTNRLRLQRDEGRYLGEARARQIRVLRAPIAASRPRSAPRHVRP